MHELTLADGIVRVACEAAAGRRVERVEVKVGHLRQVVPSALEFAFALVAEGTAVDGAELAIEAVPARVEFDVDKLLYHVEAVHPGVERLLVSARTGEGMNEVRDWLVRATTRQPVPA